MDIIDQATEILKKSIGWIELDLDLNLEEWENEAKIAEKFLVDHREGEGHVGWRSCCIHGIDIDKTGHWSRYADQESDVNYKWTDLSYKTPIITNFWKSFPTEKFARLRFMQVLPGGFISPHNDSPSGKSNIEFNMMDHMIPINLAITHPHGCDMKLETYGIVPFVSGKAFIVNITDTHSVQNKSSMPRMHMIAHCIIGNRKKEFSELVVRSYNKNRSENNYDL